MTLSREAALRAGRAVLGQAKDLVRALVARVVSVSPIRRALRRARDRGLIPDRVARSLALRGDIPIVGPWAPQFLMHSDPRNVLVRMLHFFPRAGGGEPETFSVFVGLIDHARVFVDVGANQGLFTLIAAARNPDLRVYAFEPNPNANALLRTHIAVNDWMDRVNVSSLVVSDQPGVVDFRVPESPYAAVGAIDAVSRARSGTVVELEAVRLDDVVGDQDVDVIKVDVEGAESLVIRGAEQTLRRTRAAVILEVLEPYDYAGAERLLRDLDYDFFHLTPAGPVPAPSLVPDVDRVYRNYLCLPRGILPAVEGE